MRYDGDAMGNREELLAGALRCLKERGWARTTVRDIAASAGVNHAAIGYHFGSKDALLAAALVDSMDTWSNEVFSATAAESTPVEQWRPVLEWMAEHHSALLANLDLLAQAQRSAEMLGYVADVQEKVRREGAAWVRGAAVDEVPEDDVGGLGSVYMALISGLAAQAIVSPESVPSAAQVVAGVRELAAAYEPAGAPQAAEPHQAPESDPDPT